MMRLHYRIAVFALAAGLAVAAPAFAQGTADEFQKVSLQQIMGASWPQFERTLAALTADPRNDQAFQELSVVVSEAGALNKIAPYLELALKQRPDDLTMRTILGRVCKDLVRDGARAKEHFEAVLKADADNFFAHYQLGAILARTGEKEFPQAIGHYRTAVEKIPRQYADLRTRILREMGDLLYGRREANPTYEAEALAAWDAMTSGARKFDLQTYEELAAEYRSRQLWQKEQETYERYFTVLREINDTPDNVTQCRLKTRIAEACERREQYAQAVAAMAEAAALLDENAPQRRPIENRIRQCRQKLSQGSVHEQELRKALEAAPQSIAARQALARVLVQDGRLDDAAGVLEEARKLSPRNVPVLSALEAIYRKAGRDDALAAILRARIEQSAEDYGASLDLADLHVRNGRMADAEKVLADLEASPSQLSEKYLLLARACGRYGLPKRALLLYRKAIDSGGAGNDDRVEFCDFCLAHKEFADEATAQATALCDGPSLDAAGFVRVADVFRKHDRNDQALGILGRGLARCAKRPDGSDDRQAIFTLNLALSDLEHRMGEGHRSQAIGSTLRALLSSGDLHFKTALNDRLVTLLTHYGHRTKLLYSPQEEKADASLLGGPRGAGIAPWVDFLSTQANSREDADLWMLLGQVQEAVEVDAELPLRDTTQPAAATSPATRHIKTSLAQARLCYQKVVDMEFQNTGAHLAMARVLADPGIDEYERAVNELDVLGLLNPVTRWESLQAMGDLYASAGETAQARQKWLAVAEQAGGEPSLLHEVAMRMFRGGELKMAIELAQRARDINPNVFAYRMSCANLLGRLAAAESTAENLVHYVDELGEALTLAQKSPALSDCVPAIARELLRGQLALARRCFDGGDIAAAKRHLERSITMLKSSGQGDQADDVVQAALQVARCDEAAGGRDAAMKRYEALLKDRPEMLCWVSGGLSVSGQNFLAMKRRGLLAATQPASASGPAAPGVHAAVGGEIDLDDTVRAILASPSSIDLEGRRQRYRVDAAAGKLTASMPRAEPLAPGPASLVPAGDGRSVRVIANDVSMVRLDTGEVVWTRASGEVERLGRVMGVKATKEAVVLSCQKGLRVLNAADGKALWEHAAASGGFDVSGDTVVLVTGESGDPYWATLDLKTGRQIARRDVSAGTLWYWPVLTGRTVLMSDSLGGVLTGFDAGTGRQQFELKLDTPLVGPPVVAGGKVMLHTLRAGAIHASVLDPVAMQARAQVPLSAGGHSIAALFLPPPSWRERVLYYDASSDTVLAMNTVSGAIDEVGPKAAASRPSSMPVPAVVFWTVCGDILCLVGADGRVRLWRLEAAK